MIPTGFVRKPQSYLALALSSPMQGFAGGSTTGISFRVALSDRRGRIERWGRAPRIDPLPQAEPTPWLKPGAPTAHKGSHLPLLPSGPGGVRESLLRWTQLSTPLHVRQALKKSPAAHEGFSPAIADCRWQGTATSPP